MVKMLFDHLKAVSKQTHYQNSKKNLDIESSLFMIVTGVTVKKLKFLLCIFFLFSQLLNDSFNNNLNLIVIIYLYTILMCICCPFPNSQMSKHCKFEIKIQRYLVSIGIPIVVLTPFLILSLD